MHNFKELKVWQQAMTLVKEVYLLTKNFPSDEKFGLAQQIQRACISIPSNIAEGSQRVSDKEFSNFILIAKGSLAELETQMIIAQRRKLLLSEKEKILFGQIEELNKMIYSFYQKLIAAR